jgi:DNA-binding response OmpR family regulator
MTNEIPLVSSILVIDDNAEHLELVRRTLTARGYQVFLAADATTGLQLAIEQRPDILIRTADFANRIASYLNR